MKSEIKPISGVDDRVKLADVIPIKTPFTFNIFPTNACNFRCNYCAQSLGAENLKSEYHFTYETMTLKTLELAVNKMIKFPKKFKLVSMMGHGEPLLNKDLPEMIRCVYEAGVAERIEIITNGSLLTPQLSEKLIDAGLSAIRISLQGLSSQKYQEISKAKLDFKEFIENIRYFYSIKRQCKVFVKVVDTALEDGEEERFYQIFGNISDRMYVEKVKPVYSGVEYKEKVDEILIDRYGNVHKKRLVCPLTFFMLSMWPNGDIVPCDAIYKPVVLGNVYQDDLISMWNNEKLRAFQTMHLKKEKDCHKECKKCCAPDDVSHPLDVLDDMASSILTNFYRNEE
jgi:radical SAM protein with 4Fe4S-binding SPASM domain